MTQINKSLSATFFFPTQIFHFKAKSLLKFFNAFLILVVFSLLAVSVYQLNTYTANIYFIDRAQKEISELTYRNKMLEISLAQANSLAKVEQYVQGFEKTNKVEYIRILEHTTFSKMDYVNTEN